MTALAVQPTEAPIVQFDDSSIDLIKRTICKGATQDELQLFLMQCKRTGLDPFAKQIHAVKRWDGKQQREVMSIQVGIDGLRLVAERTGKYAGNDEYQYETENNLPTKATATVWKIVGGQRVPFTRSVRYSEFVQTDKAGNPNHFWKKMPFVMLGKVAEAHALRCAFPQELSGLYTPDEMGDVELAEVTQAAPKNPPPQQWTEPVEQYDEPHPDPKEIKDEVIRTGITWSQCIAWISKKSQRQYTNQTTPAEMDLHDARAVLDKLKRSPNFKKVEPAKTLKQEYSDRIATLDTPEQMNELIARIQTSVEDSTLSADEAADLDVELKERSKQWS